MSSVCICFINGPRIIRKGLFQRAFSFYRNQELNLCDHLQSSTENRLPAINTILFLNRHLKTQYFSTVIVPIPNNIECVHSDEVEIEKLTAKSVLGPCEEDVTLVAPYFPQSFNFAAYVNKSPTLQEFVKLGVDLHKWEKKKGIPQFILKLDFERDVKNHLL